MSAFWSGWIAGIVVLSLIGLAWLLASAYRSRPGDDAAEPDAVWDGTLREANNPAPLWWLALIVALLAYTVVYLVLYPGLGNFPGALKWTRHVQLERRLDAYEERYGALRERWRGASVSELAADPQAMRSAAGIYQTHCSGCHGADARGQARLFPNLADASWQWGGDETQIANSIANGRNGLMPPWGAVLQDKGVAQVADYLLALAAGKTAAGDTGGGAGGTATGGGDASGGDAAIAAADAATAADKDPHSAGRKLYSQFCVACHGAEAQGNPALGAPNLADSVWLYGGDEESVRHSIALGRVGVMPAWKERLDETQIRLLTAWLANGAQTAED
ncbi:MAG: c-type cytochrome [Gammaproteobacteria bacterium]|nr:c-type cytochrome [Gammaproteobacteria bacterium]